MSLSRRSSPLEDQEGTRSVPPPAVEPRAEDPGPQDGLQLRPERNHPVRRAGLEGPPAIRADGDRLSVEGDIVELEAGDFAESTSSEQEEGDQDVGMGCVVARLDGSLLPAQDAAHHDIRHAVGPAGRTLGMVACRGPLAAEPRDRLGVQSRATQRS